MKRELKREELGKLYKQFSRQKYNKYKHQYPRMRESQLVSKVIKEWESLSMQEKIKLFKTYSDNKELPGDGSESSDKKESPGSSKEKKKKPTTPAVNPTSSSSELRSKRFASSSLQSSGTPEKKGTVRVFNKSSSSKKEKDQSVDSGFERNKLKKDFEVSEEESGELGQRTKKVPKSKRITKSVKQPRTEYLKFFTFYYEKLSKEHSKWSANQISTIIKLLWRKKQVQDKQQKKSRVVQPREQRKTSGRMTFRKNFDYSAPQAYVGWKQLPQESKLYWKNKGQGVLSNDKSSIEPNITFKSTRRFSRKGSEDSEGESIAEKLNNLLNQKIL